MFRGINSITVDVKGRIAIPMRYREALSAEVVLTIDTEERCLLLYKAKTWQEIENKLQLLPSFDAAARRVQRLLIGYATDLEMDTQGRILLPQLLREYAHIDKQAMLIGQGNKFEIWNQSDWQERCENWLAAEKSPLQSLPDEMKNFYL